MGSRSMVRTRAEAAAIASVLVVAALGILFWDSLGWRGLLGLLVLAPSGVMLGYYIYDKGAPDRIYSIGLYSFLIVVALLILGVSPRYVLAGFLFLLAGVIVAYHSLARG